MRVFLLGVSFLLSSAAGTTAPTLTSVQVPNHIDYWQNAGFIEMIAPLRLPTDVTGVDTIGVWLKLPDDGLLTVAIVNDSTLDRPTLVYPPGTVADRVEYQLGQGGVDDVRGAMIDATGTTNFHVYETAPGHDQSVLMGFQWPRSNDAADVAAGVALAQLFYPDNPSASQSFRQLNHCSQCHAVNAPIPALTTGSFTYESDSRGFFQPISVLADEITVHNERPRDQNSTDPFITIYCGDQPTTALTNSTGAIWYQCPGNVAPMGKLDVIAALKAGDSHAQALCASRRYLFEHMDTMAQAAYPTVFQECGIQ